jgi:hypothetical protein
MSEHEVPLEELTEHIHHEAHSSHEMGQQWISGVALSTAFMATFAAIAALLSSHYESESLKEHSEAFDKWAYYQAKGIKGAIVQSKVDTIAALGKTPDPKDFKNIERYKKEQEEISQEAKHITEVSEAHTKAQERFALAVTMFQVAIAVGAISVLTRRKPFWFVSLVFGAAGLVFGIMGVLKISNEPEHEKTAEHSKESKEGNPSEHAKEAH